MKNIIALAAALTMIAPALATAQSKAEQQVKPLKVTTSTGNLCASASLCLQPPVVASVVVGVAIIAAAASSNGT